MIKLCATDPYPKSLGCRCSSTEVQSAGNLRATTCLYSCLQTTPARFRVRRNLVSPLLLASKRPKRDELTSSFVPVIVPKTGTNAKRPPQRVALQQLAEGVSRTSGEDRIVLSPFSYIARATHFTTKVVAQQKVSYLWLLLFIVTTMGLKPSPSGDSFRFLISC